MSTAPIEFENLEWVEGGIGARYKECIQKDQKIRLIEFSYGFIEEDWCTKGHIGFVVDGSMKIDFSGNVVSYNKGDGLWIASGEADKHKVLIEKGGSVLLFLVESL